MNKNNHISLFSIIALIAALIIIGIMLGGRGGSSSSKKQSANSIANIPTKDSPALGPTNAKVTLIEFSDFQCPYCQQLAREIMPKLEEKYQGRVRFVYKFFVLGHEAGNKAALAAYCAHRQGRFQPYRLLLAENHPAWITKLELLVDYAKTAGLDEKEFQSCRDSSLALNFINRDVQDGFKMSVNSTPTIFINEERIVGAQPLSVYETKIDELLK